MKLRALLLLVMLFLPSVLSAQQGYLEVTATGMNKLQFAIPVSTNLGSQGNADLGREIADVLRFDMNLAGPFSVMATQPVAGDTGVRPGEFPFGPWKNAGADLLVKSGYTLANDTITIEFRLYNVGQERELAAKRYTGKRSELRRIAHSFSDEIMLVLTGEKGPFTGKIAFVSKSSGNKELAIMDYDGHNVQKLTKNGSINLNPDFSPNGRELVYTSYKKGNPDLYRRDIASGAEARISSHKGINITAAWAPDGGKLALALSKDGNSQIYTIDREGKHPVRLTKNSAIDVSPAWSPDGARIAFVSDRFGKPQLFVMNADGSNQQRLTRNGAYNVSPRWSPKGDKIVYCRQMGGGFQIFSISPDGNGDAQLTNDGSNEHPRWSPDGRFITFSSTRDGNTAIYVMRADGSGQTLISRSKGDDSHPAWSPRW